MSNQNPNPGSPQQPPSGQPSNPQNLPPNPQGAQQGTPGGFLPQPPPPGMPPAYPQQGQPHQAQSYPQQPAQGAVPPAQSPAAPQQPGPQQPGRPVGPPHTPPGAFGFPPTEPTAPPKKSRKGLIIGLIAGFVGLVLIAVVAIVVVRMLSVPPSQAAARNYLEAVARGDSQAALSYAVTPEGNTDLLTDKALAESKKAAPISDIKVTGEIQGSSRTTSRVSVSYKMGSESVQTAIVVTKEGDTWKVSKTGGELSMLTMAIPATVNGVELSKTATRFVVFPGVYTVQAKSPYVSLNDGKCTSTIQSNASFALVSCDATITSEGQAALRTQAQTVLTSCAKSTAINVPACGLKLIWLPSYGTVKTAKWTVTSGANTISTAQFTPSLYNGTATAPVSISFRAVVTTTAGKSYHTASDLIDRKAVATFNDDGSVTVTFARY